MTAQGEDLPDNPWPALWALVIGFFMILVDVSIVSIATPALMESFDTGIEPVLWVTSAYLLAYAVPLLITGRFGDRYGPRRLYLIGLTAFTLASLACGLAPGIEWLIAARVAQGLGASMMTPQTMAVITRTFPPERRGSAMALWGAVGGVAFLVGPLLGGLLLDSLGWEWIFFINVPIGAIGLVAALRLVPRLEVHAHSMDWLGVALSAIGLFLVIFGLQEGEQHDWGAIGPVTIPVLIGVGLLVLVGFVVWQARGPREPLIPLRIFRDRNFSLANLAITTMGLSITAMMFPLLIWLQTVRGYSPTEAALVIAPQAIASILLARRVGHLVDRIHPRVLPTFGLGGFAVTLFVLSRLMSPDSPMWLVVVVVTFIGVTGACIWGPLATTANRNLPIHLAGAGAGVYNTTRQVGSVIGSAAIAALMSARISAHLGPQAAEQFAGGGPEGGASGTSQLPAPVAEALSAGLADAMLLPAAMLVIGALAAVPLERMTHAGRPVAAGRRSAARDGSPA